MTQSTFPAIITDPWGPNYVLANTEAEALAEATTAYGEEEVEKVVAAGWMHEVHYPEDYDNREEWEASPNFTEHWFEGCAPPVNDRQRCIRAWEIVTR